MVKVTRSGTTIWSTPSAPTGGLKQAVTAAVSASSSLWLISATGPVRFSEPSEASLSDSRPPPPDGSTLLRSAAISLGSKSSLLESFCVCLGFSLTGLAGVLSGASAVSSVGVGAGGLGFTGGSFGGTGAGLSASLIFSAISPVSALGASSSAAVFVSSGFSAGGGVSARGTGQIILAGIAGSQLFNALTSFIITKSANAEQARGIMFWLLGNLSGVRWPDVTLAVPVAAIGLIACVWYARALDAFAFGAESAASLGIPVRTVQTVLIGLTALVTAVMVSIVGSIGFVGLVIPHAARFVVGVRHGRLVPATALIGAAFLIAADVLSRTMIPGQVLPIGVITALVGAPAFALILLKGRRRP